MAPALPRPCSMQSCGAETAWSQPLAPDAHNPVARNPDLMVLQRKLPAP